MPGVFQNKEFNKKYCDGGILFWGNNIPAEPIYDKGFKDIIVVCLDNEEYIDRSKYPNANILLK